MILSDKFHHKFNNHKSKQLCEFIILAIILALFWYLLHRTPSITMEDYKYLTNLSPNLVLTSLKEGESINQQAWIDIVALKSSLQKNEATSIINQLHAQISFSDLNWGNITALKVKQIEYRRELLKRYPYFDRAKYQFPIKQKIWFQDSFGADREGGARQHEGTDLFGNEGIPILSVCSGKIEKLGWNRLGGERVGVRGEDGNYYYYAHLQKIASELKVGQKIKTGDLIGNMGHTGDALTTPDHLHFGIELPNGKWINPYLFLYVWQNMKASNDK